MAGETLAAIAGANKDALIAAIVAERTRKIDAKVTEGKITAEQAVILKSDLLTRVTAQVNEVKGKRGVGGPMGVPAPLGAPTN